MHRRLPLETLVMAVAVALACGCKLSTISRLADDVSSTSTSSGLSVGTAADSEICGEPVVEVLRDSLTLALPPGIVPSAQDETTIASLSQANLAQLQAFLGPLSDAESRVVNLANQWPPFIIHRFPFQRLQSILAQGALLSPHEVRHRGLPISAPPTTPGVEDKLYGGYDCVFAAAGPRDGMAVYGDSSAFLSTQVEGFAWGTISNGDKTSGISFLRNVRHVPIPADGNADVTNDDRLAYSRTIVYETDWQNYLNSAMIAFLRASPNHDALITALLATTSREQFRQQVQANFLGYLEVKVADLVSLDDVDCIEVPADKINDAKALPEAANYQDKLQVTCGS